jgi:hypothetical protein
MWVAFSVVAFTVALTYRFFFAEKGHSDDPYCLGFLAGMFAACCAFFLAGAEAGGIPKAKRAGWFFGILATLITLWVATDILDVHSEGHGLIILIAIPCGGCGVVAFLL